MEGIIKRRVDVKLNGDLFSRDEISHVFKAIHDFWESKFRKMRNEEGMTPMEKHEVFWVENGEKEKIYDLYVGENKEGFTVHLVNNESYPAKVSSRPNESLKLRVPYMRNES